MMLFDKSNNFEQYEKDTGWREYWVWTGKIEGWKHRSHLFDESAKPLSRVYEIPKLDPDYGTPKFIEKKKAASRSELKDRIRKTVADIISGKRWSHIV